MEASQVGVSGIKLSCLLVRRGGVGLSPAPLGRSFSISRLKRVRVYSSYVSYLLCCVAVFDGWLCCSK